MVAGASPRNSDILSEFDGRPRFGAAAPSCSATREGKRRFQTVSRAAMASARSSALRSSRTRFSSISDLQGLVVGENLDDGGDRRPALQRQAAKRWAPMTPL
jgi:hypothetical protein